MEKKEKLTILLCSPDCSTKFLTEGAVFIRPIDSYWNDFGYQLATEIGIRLNDNSIEWFDSKFAFKNQDNTYKYVLKILKKKAVYQFIFGKFSLCSFIHKSKIL